MKNQLNILLTLLLLSSFIIGIVYYSTMEEIQFAEYFIFSIIGILSLFGLYHSYQHNKIVKAGFVGSDELQIKRAERSAFRAFFGSIYLWILVIIIFSSSTLDLELIIGLGVFGMFLLYAGFWVYYGRKGFAGFE